MRTLLLVCMIGFLIMPASAVGQDFSLYDVHVLSIKTGKIQRLTTIADAGEFNPAFSPNSKLVVHDVKTFDSHSLYITDVASHVSTPIAGGEGGNDAAWSPAGNLIAFDRTPYGDPSIYTISPAGGTASLVVIDAVDASWSPTGSHIAFFRPSDGSIRVVPAGGGTVTFVGFGENPAWSPNENWIAFSASGDLWKIQVDGNGIPVGAPLQLTSGPEWDGQPTWSNNSRTIVFHSNRGGADFDLWTMMASGGTPTRLTGLAGAGDYDPSFSPNGQYVAFSALPSGTSVPGHSPGTTDPFSISVIALKGSLTTDICISLKTADSSAYPLPSYFKKLQIAVKNASGSTVTVLNVSDVPVTDGKACVSVEGLSPYQTVRVQAHVKTSESVDEEILRATGTVFLRPDLVVEGVGLPPEVRAYRFFNIEARIRELNHHVAVTATVSLYDGETLLGSVPGVHVPGGELVSVVFERIRFTETGMRTLTVKISNADPAEYDSSNNERAFTIDVLEGINVQEMFYYLSYYAESYNNVDVFSSCWYSREYTYSFDNRSLYYDASVVPDVFPETPFDGIAWRIESENGLWSSGAVADVPASYSDPYYEYYSLTLEPTKPLYGYLYVYKYDWFQYVAFSISYYASRYIYRYVENEVVYADYSYSNGSFDLEATQWVDVSILLTDGDFSAGGGARMALNPFSTNSYEYSMSGYDPYYGCDYHQEYVYSYQWSSTSQNGVTDVLSLPFTASPKLKAEAFSRAEIPKVTELSPGFPNPFNPSTNIAFTVREQGLAVLRIYNALGQQVAELFNGTAEPGRNYRFEFRAKELPSGLYFARLETGGRQFVRKLLLTK